MNATNAERPDNLADATQAAADFEGELREIIRGRDVTFLRASMTKPIGDANNLNSLIQRVAGTSTAEIDNLIRELQEMRDYLQREGERVQREITNYAQVSQAAMSSAKVILDSMGQWKSTVGTGRGERS